MFICDCCIYETKYKSNYTKHLKTKKHIKLSNRVVTLKNTNDEISICDLYKDDYCFTYSPPTKDNIDNLIAGFYSRKSGKPTVSPDAPSLSMKPTVSLDAPSFFENHTEKSSELIKKYNNIYKIIFQEIRETYGFPGRPFPFQSDRRERYTVL